MRFLTIATAALCFATLIQALPYNKNIDQFTKRDGGDNDDEKPADKPKNPLDANIDVQKIMGKVIGSEPPKEEDD